MSLQENDDLYNINSNIDEDDNANIEIRIEKENQELIFNSNNNKFSDITLNISEEIKELKMNNSNNNNNQLSNSHITPERNKILEYDINNNLRKSNDINDEDRGDLTTLASHHSNHSYQSHNSEYSDVDDSDEDDNDNMNFNNMNMKRNSINSFNKLNFGSNNSFNSFDQDSLNNQQVSPPTLLNKYPPPPIITVSPPRNKQELGIASDRFPRRSNSMPSLDVPLTNINNDSKPPFSPFSTSSTTSEMFGSTSSPGSFFNDPRISISPPIIYSSSPPTVSLPPPPIVSITSPSTISISPPLPINSISPPPKPFNFITASSSHSSISPLLNETILPPPISTLSPLIERSNSAQIDESSSLSPNSSISSPTIKNSYSISSQDNYNDISPNITNHNEITSEVSKKPIVSMFIPVVRTSVESMSPVNTTSMFMPIARSSIESIPSINNDYNPKLSVNVSQSSSVNSYQQQQVLLPPPVIIEPTTITDLPPGWTEYLSEEGWPYYLHDQSGESSWDRPAPVLGNNSYEQQIANSINNYNSNNDYNSHYSPVPSKQLSNQSPRYDYQESSPMYLNAATQQIQSPSVFNQFNNNNNNNNSINHFQNQFNNDNRDIDHKFHEISSNGSINRSSSNKFLSNNSNNTNIVAASINANGQSALHITASECMVEGLDILLKSGIHADIIDGNGHTALQIICNKPYSIQQNHCLTLLIEAGADVNICDNKGDYALHLCVLQGNSISIKTLLNAGADSNVINNLGDTPLHSSAKIGKFDCMQVLVLNNSTSRSTACPSINSPQIASPPQINTYKQYDNSNSNNKGNNNQYNVEESEQQRAWKQYEAAKNKGSLNSNYNKQSYNEINQSNDLNAWEVESNHSSVSSNSYRRQSGSNVIQSQRYVIKKKSVTKPANKSTPNSRSSSNYPNPNNISSDSEDGDNYRDVEDDVSMTSSQYRQKVVVKSKDWVELLSPNGDLYYYNEKEQKVQWENPYPVIPITTYNPPSNNNNNKYKTNANNNKMPSSMFETASNESLQLVNNNYFQNDVNLQSNHSIVISPSSRGGMYTTNTESEPTNIQSKNTNSMRTSTVHGYISGNSSSPAQSPSASGRGRGRGRLSQSSPNQQLLQLQQQPYNQVNNLDYSGRIINSSNSPTHSYKLQQQEYNQPIPFNREEYNSLLYNQPDDVVLDSEMNGSIPYSSPYSTPLKQNQDTNISYSSNDIVSNLHFNQSNDVIDINDDSLSDLSDDATQQSLSISGASRVSQSVSSSTNLNERHLQIWNKFFENVLKSDNGGNQQRDKYAYDENGKRLKNKDNKGLSVGGFSPTRSRTPRNVWPARLSDIEYNELLHAVFEANDDDAAVYDKKNTALIAAVMRIDIETSELLLLNGANSNCFDIQRRSPAHFASRVGNEFLLALLFDHGADLDAIDAEGRSPIHTASSFGNIDAVRFLLESAISVDTCDSMGNSSIHLAARGGHLLCCKLLLDYGADTTIRNNLGMSSLQIVTSIQPKTESIITIEELLKEKELELGINKLTISADPSIYEEKIQKNMEKIKITRKKKEDDNNSIKSSNSHNNRHQNGNGDWKEVAKNLKKQGSQILEEKKVIVKPLGAPKLPWANLSIDTAVIPHTTWDDKPPTAPSNSSSRNKESTTEVKSHLSNNDINKNVIGDKYIDEDEEDDEDDDSDDDGGSSSNPVANAVWGVASSLIGVTMSMFNSSSSSVNSNDSNKANIAGALKRPSIDKKANTITQIKRLSTTEFNSNSLAPPTDKELFESGIGPPKFLAAQVDEQVKMIRTGLTPRRINPRPPDEVRQAVAVFKAENERLEQRLKPNSFPIPASGIRSLNNSSNFLSNVGRERLDELTNPTGPPVSNNSYSMGKSLPKGVNSRYVNVFDNPDSVGMN